MGAKVFISYRREDAKYPANQIYAAFRAVLPSENVFMDVHSIPPGVDFIEVLKGWVGQCDVLLALIGPGWVDASDPRTGRRRLVNENDFVRVEIREALARGIPVVPVLLDGTPMPDPEHLPDDLKQLAYRQAQFIDFRTFDAGVEHLIKKLALSEYQSRSWSYEKIAMIGAAVGGVSGLVIPPILGLPWDSTNQYLTDWGWIELSQTTWLAYAAFVTWLLTRLTAGRGFLRPALFFALIYLVNFLFDSIIAFLGNVAGGAVPSAAESLIVGASFVIELPLEWVLAAGMFLPQRSVKDVKVLGVASGAGAALGAWNAITLQVPSVVLSLGLYDAGKFATIAFVLAYGIRRRQSYAPRPRVP